MKVDAEHKTPYCANSPLIFTRTMGEYVYFKGQKVEYIGDKEWDRIGFYVHKNGSSLTIDFPTVGRKNPSPNSIKPFVERDYTGKARLQVSTYSW